MPGMNSTLFPMQSMMVCIHHVVLPLRGVTYRLSAVNVLKAKIWDSQSEFDSTKDKTAFRQYETACDRVKNFYKEQHG
jgi:inositol oxygenase